MRNALLPNQFGLFGYATDRLLHRLSMAAVGYGRSGSGVAATLWRVLTQIRPRLKHLEVFRPGRSSRRAFYSLRGDDDLAVRPDGNLIPEIRGSGCPGRATTSSRQLVVRLWIDPSANSGKSRDETCSLSATVSAMVSVTSEGSDISTVGPQYVCSTAISQQYPD